MESFNHKSKVGPCSKNEENQEKARYGNIPVGWVRDGTFRRIQKDQRSEGKDYTNPKPMDCKF